MAAVALDQYLMSVLRTNTRNVNEVKLASGSPEFDLFTLYLESHVAGVHNYENDVSTIMYVVSGEATIKSGEKSLKLKAGNVLLLTEGWKYHIENQNDNTVLAKLKFKPGFKFREFFNDFAYRGGKEERLIKQILNSLYNEHVVWMKNNQITRAAQVMQHIINGYLNDELFTYSLISAELTVMMVLSIRNQRFVNTVSLDKTKFEGTVLDNYIDNHFTDITLTETANYFGFNPNYFSNMVKQKTGKSFVDHVDERRMQEAKLLLGQPDISLKEIIGRVGYSSKSFFYKKFNQYYGETPAVMRERLFKEANINLK